jgi:hypothetical protein
MGAESFPRSRLFVVRAVCVGVIWVRGVTRSTPASRLNKTAPAICVSAES